MSLDAPRTALSMFGGFDAALPAPATTGQTRLRDVLAQLSSLTVELDVRGLVAFANDAFLEFTGWTREEALGADWFECFVPADGATRAAFLQAMADGAVPTRSEGEVLVRDGARRLVAWDTVVLRGADGRVVGTTGVGRDVTDERRLAREHERLARALEALDERDELTGLYNRRGFRRVTEHAAKVAARMRRIDAVLHVEVQELAAVNAAHGEAAGADALRAVAETLRAVMRESDVVARGGDESFVIYAIGITTPGDGLCVARRIREALDAQNAQARGWGRAFDVAYAIGVAEREAGDDLDALMARAEAPLRVRRPAARTRAARR